MPWRWTPGPARNTQSSVSPWDVFMLVFSPHNFSSLRFFRGVFFPWVCWPHILNKLFFIWPIPGEFCAYTSQSDSTWWNVLLLCLMFISVYASVFCCVVLVCLLLLFSLLLPHDPPPSLLLPHDPQFIY